MTDILDLTADQALPLADKMFLTREDDGKLSLWDNESPGSQPLEVIRFTDGTIGLLPELQAQSLDDLLQYGLRDEEKSYAENGDENDVLFTQETQDKEDFLGTGSGHIVHAYHTLMRHNTDYRRWSDTDVNLPGITD